MSYSNPFETHKSYSHVKTATVIAITFVAAYLISVQATASALAGI